LAFVVRPARLEELLYMSELCLRSKAIWDYATKYSLRRVKVN